MAGLSGGGMGFEGVGHRQAGHLRRLPPSGAEPRRFTVSLRRVLEAMAVTGLAERSGDAYRRTPRGDRALAAYDAALDEGALALLSRVGAGGTALRGSWDVQPLAAAGLVSVRLRTGDFEITDAGRALLAARSGGRGAR